VTLDLPKPTDKPQTLIDELLAEQRSLTAVERFARAHDRSEIPEKEKHYRSLLPTTSPKPGQQYAFEVDLDKCSGCKACVTACHSLNGLDETETWRTVGLLVSRPSTFNPQPSTFQQHVTTACHHCADPGCANGCPVLAYDKDPVTGIVRHLDDQCIGCSYCVMKCPYEVPKYSDRLGIVRKCDMCSQRLAVGEAPACVQACPDEAIKITLVDQSEIVANYRAQKSEIANNGFVMGHSSFGFLPDAPDPRITLPTTRFLSTKLPSDLVAADHAAPRLDHAHWPLVIMLVLTQASTGMFVAAAVAGFAGANITGLTIAAFAVLNVGLVASVLHLGQPLKAWRAFLGWRKSWLSREIIAFNAFAGAAVSTLAFSFAAVKGWLPNATQFVPAVTGAAALAGLAAVFTSAMVYVDTKRALWSLRFVFTNFYGTTLLLGATFAAVSFALSGAAQRVTQTAALAALVIRGALFAWRRLHWRAALRDAGHPIHFNACIVRALIPWTMTARTVLFVSSTIFGLLALANVGGTMLVWACLAALTTFSSEIIVRYVFFVASTSKRMPGGFAA
jgi:Fe-S-cluster-containing dehydrogenase component/DMSO reductase anchor subunit